MSLHGRPTGFLFCISTAGCRIFGYQSVEALMRSYFHCFQLCFECDEKIKTAFKKNGHWEDTVLFKRKDGSEFIGQIKLVSFSSGGKDYILNRVLDVQDQKNIQANLLREIQKFEALFQYATMAIMVADKEGNIILSNKLALSLFNYEESEMLQLKVEELIMRFRKTMCTQHKF
jgi:PAS domain S-box-containing protein